MNVLSNAKKLILPALLCAGLVGCTTNNATVSLSNVGTGNGTLVSGGAQTGYVLGGGVTAPYNVMAFSLSKSGTATATSTITLSNAIGPTCLAVDPTNGTLYVGGQDYSGTVPVPEVLAYPVGATTPSRIIVGNATTATFDEPIAMTVDSSGSLYIASTPLDAGTKGDAGTVTVYASTANGAATPTHVLSGGSTGLYQPTQLVVDSKGTLYVSNDFQGSGGNVVEFTSTMTGNVAPARAITDNLHVFNGVAVDSTGTVFVLAGTLDFTTGFVTNAQVSEYSSSQSGPASPVAVLSGGATGLGIAGSLQIDAKDNIYVSQRTSTSSTATEQLLVFGPNVANATAPAVTIAGGASSAKFLAFGIH